MIHRAFVTYASGEVEIYPYDVVTERHKECVMQLASHSAMVRAGIDPKDADKLNPQRVRELSAKVEFFRVAHG